MKPFLTKCAILLCGLYITGLALWHLGCTVVFEYRAQCIPGIVEDVIERPFEDVLEKLQHGNLPWDGDIAYTPFVRYELYGNSVLDDKLPDLDNHNYANGQAVEVILDPQHTYHRHLNKAKFLWGRDLLLLGLGALLLLVSRFLWRRRRTQKAPASQPAPRPASKPAAKPTAAKPAPQRPAPESRPEPPAAAEDLVLTAEPPAPRKRRKRSSSAKSTTGAGNKKTRSRKTDTASADKPKTTRRRKKAADSA